MQRSYTLAERAFWPDKIAGMDAPTFFGLFAVSTMLVCYALESRSHWFPPKTPAVGAVTVKVTNWRNADLVELRAAESGSADWKKVLGALKAGQWTTAKVPQGNNCRVDLRGKYADGQSADASNVDVSADKTVDLTN